MRLLSQGDNIWIGFCNIVVFVDIANAFAVRQGGPRFAAPFCSGYLSGSEDRQILLNLGVNYARNISFWNEISQSDQTSHD